MKTKGYVLKNDTGGYTLTIPGEEERLRPTRLINWLESGPGRWYTARVQQGHTVILLDTSGDETQDCSAVPVQIVLEATPPAFRIIKTGTNGAAASTLCGTPGALLHALDDDLQKRLEFAQYHLSDGFRLADGLIDSKIFKGKGARELPDGFSLWNESGTPGFSNEAISLLHTYDRSFFVCWTDQWLAQQAFTHCAVRTAIRRKLKLAYPAANYARRKSVSDAVWPTNLPNPPKMDVFSSFDERLALLAILLGAAPERVVFQFGPAAVYALSTGTSAKAAFQRISPFSSLVWRRLLHFAKENNWPRLKDENFLTPGDAHYPGILGEIFGLLRMVRSTSTYQDFLNQYVRTHGTGEYENAGEHCNHCCDVHEVEIWEKAAELDLDPDLDFDAPELAAECQGCCGRWEVQNVVGTIDSFPQPYVECFNCCDHGGPGSDESCSDGGSDFRVALYEDARQEVDNRLNETMLACPYPRFAAELRDLIMRTWPGYPYYYVGVEIAGMLLLLARYNGASDWEMGIGYRNLITAQDRQNLWKFDPKWQAADKFQEGVKWLNEQDWAECY
jgi:hypothetical protein